MTLLPLNPTSPQPRSSHIINIMFGVPTFSAEAVTRPQAMRQVNRILIVMELFLMARIASFFVSEPDSGIESIGGI